jgi:uncharacterized membrane protein YfcA
MTSPELAPVVFTALVFAGSVAAGCLGALTGLGGGVVVISMLVLGFGVDLRYAIGASLVAVIATSTGSAAAYVREGYTNTRLAMLLEVATAAGAITGAYVAGFLRSDIIVYVFAAVLFWSAWNALREPVASPTAACDETPDPLATRLKLDSSYPTPKGIQAYRVRNVPGAFVVMLLAGVLSAVVGIGSGVFKVLAMDRLMHLPFKVSTTTSNFMIGVTAAASAGVYLHRGQLEPTLCAPVALGAMAGALIGTKILARAKVPWLRVIFAITIAVSGVQMVIRAIQGDV